MKLVDMVDGLLEGKEFEKACKATGRCYEQSGELLLMNPKYSRWLLVHGRPTLQRPPYKEYGHAWLENGETVYDPTTRTEMPRFLYYQLGQIDYRKNLVYTQEEMRQFVLLTQHWGPWEGPEGVPPTAAQKREWREEGRPMPKRSKKPTKPKGLTDLLSGLS